MRSDLQTSLWARVPQGLQDTGVGSLPHHNVDSALEYSFKHSVPFLPQLPARNPREFMVAQALSGLPGLRTGPKGEVSLDLPEWEAKGAAFVERLASAFTHAEERAAAFEDFLPSPEDYSAWMPFLWEVQQRGARLAKVQIAGPMTSQWVLRLSDGTAADKRADVAMAIFRLVLAKSLSLVRALTALGVTPLVVLDEPAFYGFSRANIRHLVGISELRLSLQTLRREGALVGIHCCSNTDWDLVLGLGMDLLSVDAALALPGLLQNRKRVADFLQGGGRFCWGVIPTARGGEELSEFDCVSVCEAFQTQLAEFSNGGGASAVNPLSGAWLSAACGLALHTPQAAETVLVQLKRFRSLLQK